MSKRLVRKASILLAATMMFPLVNGTPAVAQTPDPDRVAAVARPDRTARPMSVEASAATSKAARDMRGSRPSLYRGIYFHADQESFRKCVADREGSFTYMVRGGGGNDYYGTYQMSAALVRGASWMMAAESRETRDGLRAEARSLLNVPGNKWSRYWQDRAFYTVLNYNGKWSGKAHWAGGRWHC